MKRSVRGVIFAVTAAVVLASCASGECSTCTTACPLSASASVHSVTGDTCAHQTASTFSCAAAPSPSAGVKGSWYKRSLPSNGKLELAAMVRPASNISQQLSDGGIRVRVFLACGGGGKSAKCVAAGEANESSPLVYTPPDTQRGDATVLIFVSGTCSPGGNCTCGTFDLRVTVTTHRDTLQIVGFILCGVLGVAILAGSVVGFLNCRKRRRQDLSSKYSTIQS